MRRRFFLALAIVVIASASCQKQELCGKGGFIVTATVESERTRMSYNVAETEITASWSIGDRIFGYDDLGRPFTFTISDVDAYGRATVDAGSYDPAAATKIYALFYPGKGIDDFVDGALPIDLSLQSGKIDGNAPLIMCASGSIVDDGNGNSSVALHFFNRMAIIGLKQFKVDKGVSITSLELSGAPTSGSLVFGTGGFSLKSDEDKKVATISFQGGIRADAGTGIVDEPEYFVVFPEKDAEIMLYARSAEKTYVNIVDVATFDIMAGNYYYMVKKLGIGAIEVPETGRMFPSLGKALSVMENFGAPYTIRLLNDCVEDTLTLNCPAKVTIDLNGHTLETSVTINGEAEINDSSRGNGTMLIPRNLSADGDVYGRNISLTAGSKLTINGGNFVGRKVSPMSYDHIQIINCNGTNESRVRLVINDGTFSGNSQAGIVLVTKSDVIVENGVFTSEGTYGRAFRVRGGGKVTVNGGRFTSANSYFMQFSSNADSESTFTMKNGTVATKGVMFSFGSSNNVKLNVSGGNMATPDKVAIFGGDQLSKGTITLTGGKYTADCSSVAKAATGYIWNEMAVPDAVTVPGYTLRYEIVQK